MLIWAASTASTSHLQPLHQVKTLFREAATDDIEYHSEIDWTNEYQTHYFLYFLLKCCFLPCFCLMQVVLYCFLLQIIYIREALISGQGPFNTCSTITDRFFCYYLNVQFLLHRKHTMSPVQRPTSYSYLEKLSHFIQTNKYTSWTSCRAFEC
jgi:hypothetical protein